MIDIRSLIENALVEAKLCNRKQKPTSDQVISAFMLLKNRLADYSNTNLLSFTRKEVNIDLPQQANVKTVIVGEFLPKDEFDIIIDVHAPVDDGVAGQYYFNKLDRQLYIWTNEWVELQNPENYFIVYPDIEVQNLQEVVRCYRMNGDIVVNELSFLAYEDFYQRTLTNEVYSVLPIAENAVKVFVKAGINKIKLMYNEHFEITIDTVLHIPDQFIALFTAALVLDLARMFPRLSSNTIALIEKNVEKLENNVRRSSAVNKFIGRDIDRRTLTYGDFVNGRFLTY
jgi:hypothetical protein